MGNPASEANFDLQGWGAVQAYPFISPTGDTTKRYQLLDAANSLTFAGVTPGTAYDLTTEVEDGGCTDNFQIIVAGTILYNYIADSNTATEIKTHFVAIPSNLVTGDNLTVTFLDTSTDGCGLAAVYNVQITPGSAPTCLLASFCNTLFNQNDYKVPYGGKYVNGNLVPFSDNEVNKRRPYTDYISDWGCTITSAAMIVNYYSRLPARTQSSPALFQTDPPTLNNWLVSNNGYQSGDLKTSSLLVSPQNPKGQYYTKGLVIWDAVGSYASGNGLTMSVTTEGPNDKDLNTYLSQQQPVELEVKTKFGGYHWIVALAQTTENGASTWQIYDPDPQINSSNTPTQSITTLLDAYKNSYLSMAVFDPLIPTTGFTASSDPVQMLVTDSQGRQSGFNPATGTVISQIPGSSYFDGYLSSDSSTSSQDAQDSTTEMVELDLVGAEAGTYTLQITTVTGGTFSVELLPYEAQGQPASAQIISGQLATNGTATYDLSYSSSSGSGNIQVFWKVFLPFVSQPGGS